jgi:hypothetical protein
VEAMVGDDNRGGDDEVAAARSAVVALQQHDTSRGPSLSVWVLVDERLSPPWIARAEAMDVAADASYVAADDSAVTVEFDYSADIARASLGIGAEGVCSNALCCALM